MELIEGWLENTSVTTHKHRHTAADTDTDICTQVMGLNLNAISTVGMLFALCLSPTHKHTHASLLSPLSCSQSTQTDMRAAGNQQSGTMNLGESTLEELLEQQEVGLETDGASDYSHCMAKK